METMNISAVADTAMETTTTSAPKHKWLSKLTRGAKKATMFCTVAGIMASTCATQAFAAGTGVVDTSSFITTACTVLKSVICLIGGGVSLWGVVNLLEGYGNDNPGAKRSYWNPNNFRSGTGQAVRMAQKKGIEIINLFEMSANSVKSPDKRLTDGANSSIMDISNHLEVSTMPRKKKTETAPVAEVKAEVVTEAVKETVAEAPTEKPAKKTAVKKAPAKKTATKAKTPAKAAEKKTTAKTATKTAAKTTRATAPVETVKVQFGGDEYDFAEIKKAVEADYKSKFKGKVKTIEFYIKPEDKAVYYVINGDFSDKIEL